MIYIAIALFIAVEAWMIYRTIKYQRFIKKYMSLRSDTIRHLFITVNAVLKHNAQEFNENFNKSIELEDESYSLVCKYLGDEPEFLLSEEFKLSRKEAE